MLAQMIKLDLGVRAATIDLGGWDTHEYQELSGTLSRGLTELAQGLRAFYADLDGGYTSRLTVVVMSEFGRRVKENASYGTDHGHGSLMLALGGGINGGVYGEWRGLRSDALYEGIDLPVTTDYRRILSELVVRRLRNPLIEMVFPNYTYAPLGIAQGDDTIAKLKPTYMPLVVKG
jgi:uncharacterized protein (DUF1501 family)